jgi:GNAT superfamily N-acetyltransferase
MIDPFPPSLTSPRLLLERLEPGMEEPLQEVFKAAGDHFTTITGRPEPDPDAARREIEATSSVAGREVFLLRLRADTEAVGAVGWWEGHPEPDIALLGMLLVVAQRRRMGIGREALEMLEDALRRRGIRELRTGVGAGDSGRQQLLLNLGFVPLDERKHVPLDRGRVMIALFRKELGSGDRVNG